MPSARSRRRQPRGQRLREEEMQVVRRIGVSEHPLPLRLDELLALLQQHAHGARLELLWASSGSLQALWAAGEVDLAVVAASGSPADAQLYCQLEDVRAKRRQAGSKKI